MKMQVNKTGLPMAMNILLQFAVNLHGRTDACSLVAAECQSSGPQTDTETQAVSDVTISYDIALPTTHPHPKINKSK